MFKKIATLIRRDLISTTRDAILIYMTAMPIILSLGLRFFMPTVSQASIQLVVEQDLAPLVEELVRYADVDVVAGRDALERRVLAYDDAVGIVATGDDGYRLVLEGNESHDATVLPEMILAHLTAGSDYRAALETVGEAGVPFRSWAGAFVGLSVTFLAAIVMAMHIVEDKESGMMAALGVTPLRQQVYILARSLFVFLLGQIVVFGSLLALGVTAFNPLQVAAATLAGALGAVLFGFALGALSSNQLSGIANLKVGFLLILAPAIASLFIPAAWHVALYWLPSYWTFAAFKAILVDAAGWSTVAPFVLGNVVSAGLYLVLAFPWLQRRLDFAAA